MQDEKQNEMRTIPWDYGTVEQWDNGVIVTIMNSHELTEEALE